MPAPIGFNEEGVEKIKKSLEYTERQSDNPHRPHLPRRQRGFSSDDRWAILTNTSTDDILEGEPRGKYSWQSVLPPDRTTWEFPWDHTAIPMYSSEHGLSGNYNDPWGYAVASNGCLDCVLGHIVYLVPAVTQPYFLFEYYRHATARTLGPITGRDGVNAGVGEVTVEELRVVSSEVEVGATIATYTATVQTIPVFNPYEGIVPDGTVIQMHINGKVWEITGADCENGDT